MLCGARGEVRARDEPLLAVGHRLATNLAAPDASAAHATPRHLGEDVLAQVGHVEAAAHVLDRDVAHDAVEPDPRMHARFHLHQQADERIGRVRLVLPRLVPLLDDGPRHHLRRVDLPLIRLQARVAQHAREHLPVVLERRRGQLRHQMHVNLEAGVLEARESHRHVGDSVAAVDLAQQPIVGVLYAELDAGAAVPAQPAQLGGVDRVRPRLQCEPDDLDARGLVDRLLLEQGEPWPLRALPEGIGGEEEVAHKGLLVRVRVRGPRAAEHEQLDLVHRMSIHRQRRRPVGELQHGVEPVLIGALDGGFVVKVRARLARLVGAVVAVPSAREALRLAVHGRVRRGEHRDHEHT